MAEVVNNPALTTALGPSQGTAENQQPVGVCSEGCATPCSPHYIGKTVVWLGPRRPYNLIWPASCFVGPDWPCMLCTYGLFVGPSLAFLFFFGTHIHVAALAVNIFSFSGLMLSYTLAACSDPGIIPKGSIDDEIVPLPGETICNKCHCSRPRGAVHCYDCDACILELDHHCPWTGKCIGKNNLKYFYAFLSFLCLHIGVLIVETMIAIAPRQSA